MGRIVVVDDEETILEALEALLSPHEVVTFTDPKRALAYIEETDEVDVLITDLRLGLGTFNGFMLSAEVKRLKPDVKILLLSGYIDENSEEDRELASPFTDTLMSKPFEPERLLRTVERLCNGECRSTAEEQRAN